MSCRFEFESAFITAPDGSYGCGNSLFLDIDGTLDALDDRWDMNAAGKQRETNPESTERSLLGCGTKNGQ